MQFGVNPALKAAGPGFVTEIHPKTAEIS
jgi:hypothetical protein